MVATIGGTQRQKIREELLIIYKRCAYCGAFWTTNNPPTIEHIVPRSKGGSNRNANLCLTCGPCNNKYGNRLRKPLPRVDWKWGI